MFWVELEYITEYINHRAHKLGFSFKFLVYWTFLARITEDK